MNGDQSKRSVLLQPCCCPIMRPPFIQVSRMPNAALHKHRRVRITKADKAQVYRTYGNDCHLCSHRIPLGQRSVDHVKSNRAGGATLLANLRPCHAICNSWRGARPLTAALKAEIAIRYEALGYQEEVAV